MSLPFQGCHDFLLLDLIQIFEIGRINAQCFCQDGSKTFLFLLARGKGLLGLNDLFDLGIQLILKGNHLLFLLFK